MYEFTEDETFRILSRKDYNVLFDDILDIIISAPLVLIQ